MSTTWAQNNPSLGPKWNFAYSLTTTVAWQLKVFARCKYADDLSGAAESLDEIERALKTARHSIAAAESLVVIDEAEQVLAHLLTSTADGGAK